MAFWSSEKLRLKQQEHQLFTPCDESAIKHAAYELALGNEAFVTSFETGVKQILKEGEQLRIPPGHFGLLITKEVVKVPNDAIALISIRASVKFRGLVNISGFHVDPGYEGQLQFAVYNAGSQAVVLDFEQRIFMIWYASLDQATEDGYSGSRGKRSGILAHDVEQIQGDIASPGALKTAFDELEKRMVSIEKDLLLWRTIGIALLLLVLGSFLKPYLDRSIAASPKVSQVGNIQTSSTSVSSTPVTTPTRRIGQ